MTEIICVASQKGGVGKTTASIHIAAGIALLNYKTLLIDLDPQRNATNLFTKDIELQEDNYGVYSVFQDGMALEDKFFIQTRYEKLHLLPSTIDLSRVNSVITASKDAFFLLKNSLLKYKNHFDFIIIDCPPNLSRLTLNAMVFATGLLVPTQVSKFAIDGIVDLLKIHKNVVDRYNPNLRIIGALLNNFNSRTSLSRVVLPVIQKHIPVLKTKISHSVAIEEAHFLNETLYEYKDKHKLSTAYKKIVKEILKFYEA